MLIHFNSLRANCVKIGRTFLALGILLNGCLQAQDNKVVKDKPKEDALKELSKEIQIYVNDLRDLQYKKPVDVGIYTPDELRDFMKKEVEESLPQQKAYAYKKLLVTFGIIAPDTDIKELLVNLYTSQIAGFYDPRSKQLKMIKYTRKNPPPEEVKVLDAFLLMLGKSYDGMIMAHELTHAAQDQNFDLLTIPIDNDFNEDLGMATRAIVEGDAMKIMYQYILGKNERIIPTIPKFNDRPIPGVPPLLGQQLVFPYTEGYKFVSKVCGDNQWVYVNELFSDLPASTEQILHPEKYMKERDYPIDITLPNVIGVLGPQWTEVGNPNVWGEFSIRQIFKSFDLKIYDNDDLNDKWANVAADGWGGDKYELFEKKMETQDTKNDSSAATLIWFTTWDTTKDAQEFFDAYKLNLDKKYKGIAELSTNEHESARYPILGGFAATLEMKTNDVLLIDNAPKDKIEAISKAIWGGVKKEAIKKVERLRKPLH